MSISRRLLLRIPHGQMYQTGHPAEEKLWRIQSGTWIFPKKMWHRKQISPGAVMGWGLKSRRAGLANLQWYSVCVILVWGLVNQASENPEREGTTWERKNLRQPGICALRAHTSSRTLGSKWRIISAVLAVFRSIRSLTWFKCLTD